MSEEFKEIRDYLLGFITSDEALEKVDEKLMTNEDYNEHMSAVEEELVQEYVDGELSAAEKAAFENCYLKLPGSKSKVEFAKSVRKYVDSQEAFPSKEKSNARKFSLRNFFALAPAFRIPAAAGVLAALLVGAYFGWNYLANSDYSEGLASLNKAYSRERPLQSRIGGMDYAPYERLRGPNGSVVDKLALGSAEIEITKNAAANSTSQNLLLLGRLHLTKKEFDEAANQLEAARKLDPKNVQTLNDLGVAYMERSVLATDRRLQLEDLDRSTTCFEQALQLDAQFLPALFNRALALEKANLPGQAKQAWEEYRKADPNSKWSEEAEEKLKKLPEQSKERTADEVEESFLAAYERRDPAGAYVIASRNRELIYKKYLPQKLAMSFLSSEGPKRTRALEGLKFLGEIEKEKNKDLFASDLADYYSHVSTDKIEILRNAQSEISEGYRLCLDSKCERAQPYFENAKNLFLKAGNEIESGTIATYFIAYSSSSFDVNRRVTIGLYEQVAEYSKKKSYVWFELMNFDWLLGGKVKMGYMVSEDIRLQYEEALRKAEELKDLYMVQKFLRSLSDRSFWVKDDEEQFTYIARLLEFASNTETSSRQRSRGLVNVFKVLAFKGFSGLPLAAVREALSVKIESSDPKFLIGLQEETVDVYIQSKNFERARYVLDEAKQAANTLSDPARNSAILAGIYTKAGNLAMAIGDPLEAVKNYDECLQLQAKFDAVPKDIYEVKKLRLLALHELKDDARIESDLEPTLALAEKNRKLLKEDEQTSFFNHEQDFYDVAIGHKLRKDDKEVAFDYAEISNSRSLLYLLNKSGDRDEARADAPLKVREIRERMPADVQVLQYSVLRDKVVIWVLSKEKFAAVSIDIVAADLNDKVNEYLTILKTRDQSPERVNHLSREFFDLLIAPVVPLLDKAKETCIVPNKSLFFIPFATLLSPEDKYFLEDHRMFYSPSANVFLASTEQGKARSAPIEENILTVGNPAFDRNQLRSLDDLPESEREADAVARFYQPYRNLNYREATKEHFQNAMPGADVIHFAGHYIAHPDLPRRSQLVMAKVSEKSSDNFLTGAEIREHNLPRTKLVVLSACQTGVEGYYNGEGLIGLSRSFLALGVPLVVASQWRVDSDATAELMKDFHQFRKQDKLRSSEALRQAQLKMLNGVDAKYRSPFYWAGFSAYGGYVEF